MLQVVEKTLACRLINGVVSSGVESASSRHTSPISPVSRRGLTRVSLLLLSIVSSPHSLSILLIILGDTPFATNRSRLTPGVCPPNGPTARSPTMPFLRIRVCNTGCAKPGDGGQSFAASMRCARRNRRRTYISEISLDFRTIARYRAALDSLQVACTHELVPSLEYTIFDFAKRGTTA